MPSKSKEELAEGYVKGEICYGGLEYSLSGNTAKECVQSYLAGYAAARESEAVMGLINLIENHKGHVMPVREANKALQAFTKIGKS